MKRPFTQLQIGAIKAVAMGGVGFRTFGRNPIAIHPTFNINSSYSKTWSVHIKCLFDVHTLEHQSVPMENNIFALAHFFHNLPHF